MLDHMPVITVVPCGKGWHWLLCADLAPCGLSPRPTRAEAERRRAEILDAWAHKDDAPKRAHGKRTD